MQRHSKLIPLAAVLALAAASAFAQTPTPAMLPSSTPNTVGVTPQAAAEATQKAVPRSDTGTLVRTAPSAADKVKATTGNTSNLPASGASSNSNTAPMTDTANPAPLRRARADRN